MEFKDKLAEGCHIRSSGKSREIMGEKSIEEGESWTASEADSHR